MTNIFRVLLGLTCFCSFFGRNWRHQKDISKLTDLCFYKIGWLSWLWLWKLAEFFWDKFVFQKKSFFRKSPKSWLLNPIPSQHQGFKCIKEAWFLILIFSDISLIYLPFHYSKRLNRDQCSLFHILHKYYIIQNVLTISHCRSFNY